MTGRRILLVEDDDSLARSLTDTLVQEGFIVDRARDVPETLQRLAASPPDLVLLDLMLPGGSGLDICRELAARAVVPPIIIMSALGRPEDKVRGLQLGADDYVTKPFHMHELVARIQAKLRRYERPPEKLRLGDVVVDFERRVATRGGQPLELTSREMDVLQYLAAARGRTVSRDELLRAVWGYREAVITRCVDILVKRLREKIEPDPRHPRYLRTAHGDGYYLTP